MKKFWALVLTIFLVACGGSADKGANDLKQALEFDKKVDFAKAFPLFKSSCDKGNFEACGKLAGYYIDGYAPTKDIKLGLSLYEKACEGKDTASCVELGNMYQFGNNVAEDEGKAVGLYQKACDMDNEKGCFSMADIVDISDEEKGKTMRKKGVEVLDKLCNSGNAKKCISLADFYSKEGEYEEDKALLEAFGRKPATPDYLNRATTLDKACNGGNTAENMQACELLSGMYWAGKGVAKDLQKYVSIVQRACDGGSGDGCTKLATRYLLGEGINKDQIKAIEYYQKGCDLKDSGGCKNLGDSYENGTDGVEKNLTKAAELYDRGCMKVENPLKQTCVRVANMYLTGKLGDKSPQKARPYIEKACNLEEKTACDWLDKNQE